MTTGKKNLRSIDRLDDVTQWNIVNCHTPRVCVFEHYDFAKGEK